MLAELREGRTEVLGAFTVSTSASVFGLELLAKSSKYLVVVLKPMVKWSCISGCAGAPVTEETPSFKTAD